MNSFEYHIDLQFYLAFPTDIYLLEITNKNRKTYCKICQKLTTKAPDKMRETKFSIILIFYYFHFSPLF